ncbi:MAG: diaminopimelate epimerase [Clostridia bacterium]|nr:diaminopimelate epimerase [Clostridia bacterium]
MHFTKMHGLGNDYLYVYGEAPENVAELSKKLSDWHFGVGADGMIYISPSETANFRMRIFNADGSEGKMCGNGIRCVGKYVYDKGYTDKKFLKIETLSGIKQVSLLSNNEKNALCRKRQKAFLWLREKDLNQRPPGYEPEIPF